MSPAEEGHNNSKRRKRLGQFFTGERLALLLAALANAGHAQTIVDPMGGSGDMLWACCALGARPQVLAAIEIDPVAARMCERRLQESGADLTLVNGSAFSHDSWDGLPAEWDLVITNPPYVRYQAGYPLAAGDLVVPGADAIRESLIDLLSHVDHLSPSVQEMFVQCAEDYSGLADLAVPSWLLCAARVSAGGRLAMVVPDTWLSRDYAVPVLYVLRRLFEVEYVVGDSDVSWFDDALVRTTLVVARRVAAKGSAFGAGGHLRMSLPAKAADARSLVGRAFPNSEQPEIAFASWAQRRHTVKEGAGEPVPASWSDEKDMVRCLRSARNRYRWLASQNLDDEAQRSAPELLERALGTSPENLTSLAEMGWMVGQGLRTGANDFFYVSEHSDGSFRSYLLPSESLTLPAGVVRPCVRRQSDLPIDSRRAVDSTQSRVLVLDGWALPEDIATAEGPVPWQPMAGDLARLVRRASGTTYLRGGAPTALCTLSAVRTNVRPHSAHRPDIAARFWYQLPTLVARHRPAMFMARVNAAHAAAYLNPDCSFVIDANFSSLWPVLPNAILPEAMLALLTSSWVRCYLEAAATVLGGGALKVEATHLRQLLVPRLDDRAVDQLSRVGSDLVANGPTDEAMARIDDLVIHSLHPSPAHDASSAIARLAEQLVQARSRQTNPR